VVRDVSNHESPTRVASTSPGAINGTPDTIVGQSKAKSRTSLRASANRSEVIMAKKSRKKKARKKSAANHGKRPNS